MKERERLHTLVENLPEGEVHVALRFLEFLGNEGTTPMWSLDEAPFDDEPLTEEDQRALAEAAEDVAEGRILSHADARRLLLGQS